MRIKTYQDLLATYTDDNNPTTASESRRKAQILRKTIDGEVIRTHFQGIRRVVKPSQTSSVSKILVPRVGDDGISPADNYRLLQETDPQQDLIWETVVDRDEMEKHILTYDRDSFRAAAESPLGHGLIYDALTFSGISPASSSLLSGEFPEEWHGNDEVMCEFLASFTIPERVRKKGDIPSIISEDDIRRGFGTWKESTSTSPSGRHLGHYKAIVQDPTLLRCLTQFMNIVIQSGISVPRWSNAITVLLEKDPGQQPRIHRLRIIHLFEADLIFFLKLQWGRRLVHRAVDLNLLHEGQYGSTPLQTALDPIMLTQLTVDLCQALKHDLARFDNDASACYDKIIVALGMLAARKCGMPSNAIRTHAEALEFMKYQVKSSLVDTRGYPVADLRLPDSRSYEFRPHHW